MHRHAKTVVIADISAESAGRTRGFLRERGYETTACVQSGTEAVRAVREYTPDAVVLDAVLSQLDGTAAAERILALPLSVRPSILIAAVQGLPVRRAEELCAAGCAIIGKPVEAEDLDGALARTDLRVRRVPEKTRMRLDGLLTRLGLPEREGRRFLETAILYAWQDERLLRSLTKELYPMVARRCGVDAKKVERDMRRAIEHAWKYGQIDEQYAIFGGTIDAQRGKPTCGEMIAQLADILRLEG